MTKNTSICPLGCIDELQRLLKVTGYAPGDQVVFLGDLVAKGPASLEVVQLAREINAMACRGNHDHKGKLEALTSTNLSNPS